MKKVIKIIVILLIIGGLAFGGYKIYKNYTSEDEESLKIDINRFNEDLATEVKREDMISSIDFVGNTQIKNQQKLKFNSESRVTGVFKKVNDVLKEGDLIAELDKSEINSQIEISRLNVTNAELKLKKLLENTAEVEVNKSQIGLDKLREDLENAKANLLFLEKEQASTMTDMEKTLRQKETEYRILQAETKVSLGQIGKSPEEKEQELQKTRNSLETLQTEYDRETRDFEMNYSKEESDYYKEIETKYNTLEEGVRSIGRSFTDLDELLRVLPNTTHSNNYYIYFSSKDASFKNRAATSFITAYNYYDDLEKRIDSINSRNDIEELIALSELEVKMYEQAAIAGENVMRGLDNSVPNNEFTSGTISGLYSQASSLYSNSNTKVLELKNLPLELRTLKKPSEIRIDMENELITKADAIEDLKLAIDKLEDDVGLVSTTSDDKIEQETKKLTDKEKEIEDYKLEFEKARVNNEYELDSKEKQITEMELQIVEAERNLRDLLDDSSNQDLIFAENDLKQARISLENDIKKLETYEIRAPFDGIITKIDYQPGDNLVQNDEKYILIENPDILEVNIFADQVDIMKLTKGQKAIVTYDAFLGKEFNAEIIEIDSTPQDVDGVTKYEVKISLEKPEETIYSGMNASVSIILQEKDNVITVPFSAINTDPETLEEFVVVLNENGQKERRAVVTGYSDGAMTEVLEGLEEGEKVLGIDYDANYYAPEDFPDDSGRRRY